MKAKKTVLWFCSILCMGGAHVASSLTLLPPEVVAKRNATMSYMDGLFENLGHDGALAELYKAVEENIEDTFYVRIVVNRLWPSAYNPTTESDPGILKIMRKVMDAYNNDPPYGAEGAITYLMRKGDASDLERLPNNETNIIIRYSANATLKARVEGINVLSPDFIPSVANTGAQALYVREILQRYWKEQANQNLLKIPDELLAIIVSFDEDGNPVCNVDLAKYGLSMPVITPKPEEEREHGTAPWNNNTVTFPHLGETPPQAVNPPEPVVKRPGQETESPPPEQPTEPSANKTLTWFVVIAIAVIAGITVWKQIKRKR